MIVLDASALAEYLAGSRVGAEVHRLVVRDGGPVHLPHLAVAETASVFRATAARGRLDPRLAEDALGDLAAFPAVIHDGRPFLARVWALRHAVTAYDAFYIALAEALDSPLITLDARLGRAHGHSARVTMLA